jgi:tripartite-type tricarboxylate transporter receptor subunit TctC
MEPPEESGVSHSISSKRAARTASHMHTVALACAIASPALVSSSALAQAQQPAYPNRPIRLIVPYPPGASSNDILGRGIALRLTNVLGQQVVVDNRSGASGTLGSEIAARSAPDGYTLLMAVAGPISVGPSVYPNLTYDPVRDFAPVAVFATVPYVMTVGPSVPANNIKELIALAKAKPGQLTFASSGNGGSPHLCGELFKTMAGVDMQHIPYKGSPPALQDVMGGQVAMTFDNITTAWPLAKAGKLRALAVTTATRSAVAPDVPTLAESGLPGFEVGSWQGVFAPAGTPPDIVRRLNAEIVKILKLPDVAEKLVGLGAEPVGNTTEEFTVMVKAEVVKWADVVKKSGARVD